MSTFFDEHTKLLHLWASRVLFKGEADATLAVEK
jgi:hypothetical protein